jgi:hypothetical protein
MGNGPILQGVQLRAGEIEALCLALRASADRTMNASIPKINALMKERGLAPAIARHPGIAAPADPEGEDDGLEDSDSDER